MAGRAITFNINSFREILKYYPAITNLWTIKNFHQNYTSSKRIFGNRAIFLVSSGLASSRRQDNANNKPIECKCFSEDENKDHSNKKFWLLCISSAKQKKLSENP